ncbi:MAG: hypothetical protein AAGJ37_10120 [Pseudomonadota bacterium]
MNERCLISEQNLIQYLTKKVECEVSQASLPVAEETIWYVINLLNYFAQSNNFFVQELKRKTLPTLAFLYKDASETKSNSNRNKLLRRLGDSSLFMGAWFSELYHRKGINRDYFIGMGNAAYDYLADNDLYQRQTFAELAKNFPELMSIASNVLTNDRELSTDDIFELHQKWMETNDPEIEKRLSKAGIIVIHSDFQN